MSKRYYALLKQLYVERQKRVMQPGEVIDFDDEAAAILTQRGLVVEIGEREAKRRKIKREPIDDPELIKLDNMEV